MNFITADLARYVNQIRVQGVILASDGYEKCYHFANNGAIRAVFMSGLPRFKEDSYIRLREWSSLARNQSGRI